MSEPAEIEVRVTRLEEEVTEARRDAAAARILAGGADRDVSHMQAELRAHTQSLNALRTTQIELKTTQIEQGKEMRAGFAKADANFAKIDEKFAILKVGQDKITELLTGRGEDDLGEGQR